MDAVEREIVREKVGALLGRAGLRLEEALEALKNARESIDEIERRFSSLRTLLKRRVCSERRTLS